MVRMTVLASGSRGNSTIVASATTRILVDAGLSCRELMKRIRASGEDPCGLDAILITHEHQDHVQGMAVTARKLGIPVYLTEPTHRAWVRWMTPRKRITYAEWLAQRKAERPAASGQRSGTAARRAVLGRGRWRAGCGGEGSGRRGSPRRRRSRRRIPTSLPAVEYFCSGNGFRIGDIAVTPFTIPHDAVDPVGFVFEAEGVG